MKTRILLVAEHGVARSAYTDVLHEMGVDYDCITSPDEMSDTLVNASYSGLLVDVPTMIRCECEDKNRITRIMGRFPVLRLMYNEQFGGIRGLSQGGTIRDNRDLGDFILDDCVPFAPRSIRLAERKEVIFNVLLYDELEHAEPGPEKTMTVNVSEHGCFVHSVNRWAVASPAWLVVNEFEDKTPIELKVRWSCNWGQCMRIPGIGASFESMTAHQYVQLHSYL